MIPLPQPPGCCDYKCTTPYLARCGYSHIFMYIYRYHATWSYVLLIVHICEYIYIHTYIKLCVNYYAFIYTYIYFPFSCFCVSICMCVFVCMCVNVPQCISGSQRTTVWSPSTFFHGSQGLNLGHKACIASPVTAAQVLSHLTSLHTDILSL